MALDRNVQVELPKHGIAYKKVSGKTYRCFSWVLASSVVKCQATPF